MTKETKSPRWEKGDVPPAEEERCEFVVDEQTDRSFTGATTHLDREGGAMSEPAPKQSIRCTYIYMHERFPRRSALNTTSHRSNMQFAMSSSRCIQSPPWDIASTRSSNPSFLVCLALPKHKDRVFATNLSNTAHAGTQKTSTSRDTRSCHASNLLPCPIGYATNDLLPGLSCQALCASS